MSIKVKTVSTAAMLAAVVDELNTIPTHPPSIFMDLEGIKLGRHGSISILSLYIPPLNAVYLVDVHELGSDAFNTTGISHQEASLKSILEREDRSKVIFDVRNDSDALFSHYGIRLQGVIDLQLMELARRRGSTQWLSGLAKCVEHDSGLSSAAITEWKAQKAQGAQLFAPEKGGSYDVFKERPLKAEVVQYCTWDVVIMKRLYENYISQLNDFWRKKVDTETKERIKQSQSATYDPQGRDRARGPWDSELIQEEIDQENKAMLEAWDDLRIEEIAAGEGWTRDCDSDYYDDYNDTARDCDFWEEDMASRNSPW